MHPDGIYWNPTTGKFDFYSGGQVRWSTDTTSTGSGGGQATPGLVPGQVDPSAPAPTLTPSTEQPAAGGQVAGSTQAPGNQMPGADAGTMTPTVYQHMGPGNGFSFGNLDATQTTFFNDPSNKGYGWQKLTDYLNPNGQNSNYGRFINGLSSDEYARFTNSTAADPTNTKNDWISYLEKLAPGIRDRFNSLSSGQRGENPGNYEAGVYLG